MPLDSAIVAAFDRRRAARPGDPLVAGPRAVLSVRQVDDMASRVAAHLCRLEPAAAVVLAAPAGPGFLAGLLAVRRRDLAAILVDATVPPAECRRIAEVLGAAAILRMPAGWDGDVGGEPEPAAGGSAAAHLPGIGVVKLTSGSSGEPRGIGTPDAALLADDAALFPAMGLGPADRLLAAVPWSHSYGLSSLVVPCLARGNLLIVPDDGGPDAPLAAAREFGATFFPTAPVFLQGLLRLSSPPPWPPSLRTVISAGATLPPDIAASFRARFGMPVHAFYGASECGGICYDRLGDAAERGSVGTPLDRVRLHLDEADEDGEGRVTVHSPAVAAGYIPGASDRLGDGRYRSDDVARWADGEIVLVGRAGDWINVDGRKVNPREVEAVLRQLPGVEDAAVYGEPAAGRGGETVRAVIAVAGGAPDYLQVIAWCRDHLAAHKVPRAVMRVAAIPRNARGKVDRAALRRLGGSPGDRVEA